MRSAYEECGNQEGAMRKHGFVLVTALGAVVFLILAGASLLARGLWQTSASLRTYNRSSALHLAEAGIDQAARNLRTATTDDDLGLAPAEVTLPTGTFTINAQTPSGATRYVVTATGDSDQEQRQLEVVLQLEAESVFQFALFGKEKVTVEGSAFTDSYNSDPANGPYTPYPGTGNRGHNGDIGTNSEAVGGVVFTGDNVWIDGQVALGRDANIPPNHPELIVTGYDPDLVTGGTYPATDDQDVLPQTSDFPMPDVVVPADLLPFCDNHTVGTGNNKDETLSTTGGPLGDERYCYHNLDVKGGGTLTASGPVMIYLTGKLTAEGNTTVGVPSNPTTMLFQVAPTGEARLEGGQNPDNPNITGDTKFYGALYAPETTITISGNAQVYGSVIARTVKVTGHAVIHYDEALKARTDITNTFTTSKAAWREL